MNARVLQKGALKPIDSEITQTGARQMTATRLMGIAATWK